MAKNWPKLAKWRILKNRLILLECSRQARAIYIKVFTSAPQRVATFLRSHHRCCNGLQIILCVGGVAAKAAERPDARQRQNQREAHRPEHLKQ